MKFAPFILFVIFFCSCSTTQISKFAHFESVKSNHKIIAILPAYVKLFVPNGLGKEVPKETLDDAAMKLSFIIQNEMYKWFLKNKYTVLVEDVRFSNQKLFSKGLTFKDYKTIPKDSIAKILGVDAVVFGTTDLTKSNLKTINLFLNFSSPLNVITSIASTSISLNEQNETLTDNINLNVVVVETKTNLKLVEKSYSTVVKADGGFEKFYRNSIKNFAKNLLYKK